MGVVDLCIYCVVYLLFGTILAPLILQTMGMFGSGWVPDETCSTIDPTLDCCEIKKESSGYYSNGSIWYSNVSSCKGPFDLKELDGTAYSLHAGAFAIMLLPVICWCFEAWCNKDKDDEDDEDGCCAALGGLCFFLYPIAGLLNFIGCMIVAAKFSGSKFGGGFYMCLSSGLYILVVTGLIILYLCRRKKRKVRKQPGNSTVMHSSSAAPRDSGPTSGVTVEAVNIQHKEHVVIHDPETGGVLVFMRSINIIRILTHRE